MLGRKTSVFDVSVTRPRHEVKGQKYGGQWRSSLPVLFLSKKIIALFTIYLFSLVLNDLGLVV